MTDESPAKRGDAAWAEERDAVARRNAEAHKRAQAHKQTRQSMAAASAARGHGPRGAAVARPQHPYLQAAGARRALGLGPATVTDMGGPSAREVLVSFTHSALGPLDFPDQRPPPAAVGKGVHMQTQSFAELGVSKDVVRALRADGVTKPFPVQAQVVPDVLDGRDVLVKSPTGSGKTLAFAVPLVELIERADQKAAALVLAPTRELAIQIVEETKPLARARGLNVAAVYGGTGFGAQVAAVRKAHIVVATPGRLEDLIGRGDIRLGRVRDRRAGRGRPHARHGLPPAGGPDPRRDAEDPPDPLLLGDARRRGRAACEQVHARRDSPRVQADGEANRSHRPPLRRKFATSRSSTH